MDDIRKKRNKPVQNIKFCKSVKSQANYMRDTPHDIRRAKRAFTLTEILIVIAILGILAALVLPEFKMHSQQAKESAAKDDLRILRNAIELYFVQHGDVPPGYPDDDNTKEPTFTTFSKAMTEFERRLSEMPENPFNQIALMKVIGNNELFPQEAADTDTYGWVYKPATKTLRLNWPGTDSAGMRYFDY